MTELEPIGDSVPLAKTIVEESAWNKIGTG
jgi:hypothetical protein